MLCLFCLVVDRNCNTFADALCQELVRKPIPAYINRMAYLGSFLSCLVPSEMSEQAPVGDSSGGSHSPLLSGAKPRRSEFVFNAFAGEEKNSLSW